MSSNNERMNRNNTNMIIDPLDELARRVNEIEIQNRQVKRLVAVARKVGDLSPQVEISEQRIQELIDRYNKAIQEVKDEDSLNEQR